jgi:hypothetical protein
MMYFNDFGVFWDTTLYIGSASTSEEGCGRKFKNNVF